MVLVVQVLAYPKRYGVFTDLIRALYIIFLIKDLLNYQSAVSIVTGRLGTIGGSLPYRIKFEDGAQVRSKRKVQQWDFGLLGERHPTIPKIIMSKQNKNSILMSKNSSPYKISYSYIYREIGLSLYNIN